MKKKKFASKQTFWICWNNRQTFYYLFWWFFFFTFVVVPFFYLFHFFCLILHSLTQPFLVHTHGTFSLSPLSLENNWQKRGGNPQRFQRNKLNEIGFSFPLVLILFSCYLTKRHKPVCGFFFFVRNAMIFLYIFYCLRDWGGVMENNKKKRSEHLKNRTQNQGKKNGNFFFLRLGAICS